MLNYLFSKRGQVSGEILIVYLFAVVLVGATYVSVDSFFERKAMNASSCIATMFSLTRGKQINAGQVTITRETSEINTVSMNCSYYDKYLISQPKLIVRNGKLEFTQKLPSKPEKRKFVTNTALSTTVVTDSSSNVNILARSDNLVKIVVVTELVAFFLFVMPYTLSTGRYFIGLSILAAMLVLLAAVYAGRAKINFADEISDIQINKATREIVLLDSTQAVLKNTRAVIPLSNNAVVAIYEDKGEIYQQPGYYYYKELFRADGYISTRQAASLIHNSLFPRTPENITTPENKSK